MKTLALEFSSSQRSVAVVDDDRELAQVSEVGERGSGAFGLIERVLREANTTRAEIGCIAVGVGPGSYTGIRVAIAVAQGWQLARAVRVAGVSSIEAIAAAAQLLGVTGRVTVVIDAQRNELYLATFDLGPASREVRTPLQIVPVAQLPEHAAKSDIVIGPEVNRWLPTGKVIPPDAAAVGRLGFHLAAGTDASRLEPIYLRETTFAKAPPPRASGLPSASNGAC